MKKLLSIALCFVCAVALCACSGGQSADRAHQLKIYNWSDYIDEDLLDEFVDWYYEQTGEKVEIIYQVFDINEVMLAKIERGQADYDLVCPSDYIIERMINHGLA
ncbi:MAG: spermidine/putrescine ABC transporter, partial [Bacteroidales bacterium]|nr:spermidine/putrescine ABC transporter [Bacteroidales bacterium]